MSKGERYCSLTDFPFVRCHVRRTLCIYFASIRRIHHSIITKPCEVKNDLTLTSFQRNVVIEQLIAVRWGLLGSRMPK